MPVLAEPQNETESDFNRRFKDRFARAFRRPKAHRENIIIALRDAIQYVANGMNFPTPEIEEDCVSDCLELCIRIIEKVDPQKNPAAWYRTTINHELAARCKHYRAKQTEQVESLDGEARINGGIDPALKARESREQPDYTLHDLTSKVRVGRCFDSQLEALAKQHAEAEDFDVTNGCEAAVFAVQRMRRLLLSEFRPMVIGGLRFTPTGIVRFARSA